MNNHGVNGSLSLVGAKTYKTHKGTFYFPTQSHAEWWAKLNGWPTDRIIEYGIGYAIQAGKSGNYAGPNETPRPYCGGIWGMAVGHE